MFEIFFIIMAIVAMLRLADAENRRGWIWGFFTLGLCVGSLYLMPNWPIVRIGAAFGVSFLTMFIVNGQGKRYE